MNDHDSINATGCVGKVSTAWPAFVADLGKVLASMTEDQYLIILLKQSNRFVQFAAQGAYGMRIETTSNHFLAKRERLNRMQIRTLLAMGWGDPTGSGAESIPELDPDGSPNFFREFEVPVDFGSVADVVARVLIEVIRVPHPGFLEYEAFDVSGTRLHFGSLNLCEADRPESGKESTETRAMLLAALREATGLADLSPDRDGDVGVQSGSAAILATILADSCRIRLRSPILVDVIASPALFSRLNDLNVAEDSMRFLFQNGVVHAMEDVCVDPARPDGLIGAFHRFSMVVESLDGLLREEFGGDTAFPKNVPGVVKH